VITFSDKLIISSYFHAELEENNISLLPIDHARAFPLSFNVNNKKILKGTLNFYNKPFFLNYNGSNYIDPKKITVLTEEKKFNKIAVINVLDNCHGHSLLKLFFALKETSLNKDKDFLIIIPRSLIHFLKAGIFTYTLVVDHTYASLEECYILNKVIEPFLLNYESKYLFPIDTYGTISKEELLSKINLLDRVVSRSIERITFYYRSDFIRKWQGNGQFVNVIRLFTNLKQFVSNEVIFTVIGNKDGRAFPAWIDDKRVTSYSVTNDFKENEIYAQSKIVISLTGSHMLIPSILSDCTVHLHPTYKYKNVAEDVVSFEGEDTLINSYKHLYYYGNSNCSDICPTKLTYLIVSHYLGLLEKTYKLTKIESDQESWIKQNHNYFLYDAVNGYRKKYIEKGNNKVKLLYYMNKLFGR
jgi:hypothetical protein